MSKTIKINPSPLLALIIVLAYGFLMIKAYVVSAPLVLNVSVFSAVTLFLVFIIYSNIWNIKMTDRDFLVSKGFDFIFIKKKNTLIEWDDFSDLAISYSRAIPSGDPLVLLSSDFLREKIFSIESFKMGKVASFNTKSSNCGELVDELSRVLDNRIEKERKVRLLVDKNCFYLSLDQGQLSLLSDGGEEVAKGDQLRLQVNPNNTLDIYKNGNLLGVSPNLTYSILKLLSLSQVKV